MAQPHKGDRRQIRLTLPIEVKAQLTCLAHDVGLGASDYISDLLAFAVDRPDLVRRLRQEVLYTQPTPINPQPPADGIMGPRFPLALYSCIHQRAQQRGLPMATYVRDVIEDHLGHHVGQRPKQEELLLTSA